MEAPTRLEAVQVTVVAVVIAALAAVAKVQEEVALVLATTLVEEVEGAWVKEMAVEAEGLVEMVVDAGIDQVEGPSQHGKWMWRGRH